MTAIRPLAKTGDIVLLRRADDEALVCEGKEAADAVQIRGAGRASMPARTSTAADVLALRARERVSHAVFARYLNVTTGLVSQ